MYQTHFSPIFIGNLIFYNRVNKSISLVDLRSLINKECSEPLPNEFAFIKSVGRAFAIVKENQELELKIKHFISPNVKFNFDKIKLSKNIGKFIFKGLFVRSVSY